MVPRMPGCRKRTGWKFLCRGSAVLEGGISMIPERMKAVVLSEPTRAEAVCLTEVPVRKSGQAGCL